MIWRKRYQLQDILRELFFLKEKDETYAKRLANAVNLRKFKYNGVDWHEIDALDFLSSFHIFYPSESKYNFLSFYFLFERKILLNRFFD